MLSFLRTCARNAALNRCRDLELRAKRELVLEVTLLAATSPAKPEQIVLDKETETAYADWQLRVSTRVHQKCNDEYDKQLVFWWYELGLSAQEICQRHPQVFAVPQDVYKRVRNLKERVARDPEIMALLDAMP